MHLGQRVFAQVITYLPLKAFSRMVLAGRAQHKAKDFNCLDLQGSIKSFIHSSGGKMHDVKLLDIPRQARLHRGWRYLSDEQVIFLRCQFAPTSYRQILLCDRSKKQFAIRCDSGLSCPHQHGLSKRLAHQLTVYTFHKGYPELIQQLTDNDPKTGKTLNKPSYQRWDTSDKVKKNASMMLT
jgi:hypothetical protein